MAKTGGRAPGAKDDNQDVISTIYQRLQAALDVEDALQAAEQGGDAEVLEFLRDYREAQKDLAERASNLLAARRMRTQGAKDFGVPRSTAMSAPAEGKTASTSTHVVEARVQAGPSAPASPGVTTNAQVKSGGRAGDDAVDEQSKESFPASDSSAKY